MRILAACLTCFACSAVTTSSFAQGLINWNNTASTLISVNCWLMPVNTTPETTYNFGLFIAPVGTPAPATNWGGIHDPNWQFVVAYTMNSTAAPGAGRLQNPGIATVPGYAAGTNVNFIIRSWQSFTGGADWPAAKPGLEVIGESALGTATLGGQSPGGPVYTTPAAFGTNAGQIGGFRIIVHPDFVLPWFQTQPSSKSVFVGGNVTLSAYATSNCDPIRYQWRRQGSPITGATNASLALTNVTLSDAGNYDVVASNSFGGIPSHVATVTLLIPVIAATLDSPTYTTNNQFQFTVTGTAGSNYVVQVATNLTAPTAWISLSTNASPFTFVDSNAPNSPQRFYRAYSP